MLRWKPRIAYKMPHCFFYLILMILIILKLAKHSQENNTVMRLELNKRSKIKGKFQRKSALCECNLPVFEL